MTAPALESAALPGLDFIAIDFETANPKRASVCQIGIAKIRDGQVIKKATSYVLPPPGHEHFADRNIAIHGITRRTLNNAKPDQIADWPSTLDRIIKFSGGLPLVGHNVSVERSIIVQASEACEIEAPEFEYLCSQKLAKHHLPDADSYRLNNLVEALNLATFTHHDAGEDAVACANLVIHLARTAGTFAVADLWPAPKPARPYYRRSYA